MIGDLTFVIIGRNESQHLARTFKSVLKVTDKGLLSRDALWQFHVLLLHKTLEVLAHRSAHHVIHRVKINFSFNLHNYLLSYSLLVGLERRIIDTTAVALIKAKRFASKIRSASRK